MTSLIGTVHKLQQPEVPEPEDIFRATRIILSDPGLHKVVAWMLSCARASAKLGPSPKVPVEAIRRLLNWCNDQDDFGYHLGLSESANSVHRWLSAQEEGER